jgi:nicotinamidase-related amidase
MLPDPPLDSRCALLIIDVQKAIDAPEWSGLNNDRLIPNLRRALDRWRALGWPVYFVAHDSRFEDSPYRPGQPGNDFKAELRPGEGETVVRKRTNCALIGTDLERRLREAGQHTLVVGGVVTNNSVEAAVRVAGDLGFRVYVLADGTAAVGKTDRRGRRWDAEDVHQLALANMEGEYARVLEIDELLASLPNS